MPLDAPKLDTRTFADLVKEARDRIPRFTPDWTNFNDADPGMTLVKLQAWLTETLLYEVNRLPELNYIKFLQLLNVTPVPAKAATTELHFTLKKLDRADDPLRVFIPRNTQVEADDPDLAEPLIFETDRTLTAINAAIATIIVSSNDNAQPLSLVTRYDAKKALASVNQSFYPFGENPAGGEYCLIGMLLRPHRKEGVVIQDIFPSGELDLTVSAVEVFEKDDEGRVITGPLGKQGLLPHEVGEQQQTLTWQVYVGSSPNDEFNDEITDDGWVEILPPIDETAALSRSGHLRPSLPEDISQISLHQLPRALWSAMGLKKPPTTLPELMDDLEDTELEYDVLSARAIPWEDMFPGEDLAEVIGNCESIDELIAVVDDLPTSANQNPVAAVDRSSWIKLDVGYSDPEVPEHAMAWLRVRLESTDHEATLLNGFYLNTVPATAAVTRIEETLGTSDGRPAQRFTLARRPVYVSPDQGAPDILLEIVEAGRSTAWTRVSDFYGADSHAEVYQLEESTGTVIFGDGIYGRIPVAGASIVARRYRYGGGAQGNVGENTVTRLRTSLSAVDSVTNKRAAAGGSAVETVEHAKLRAPHDLKTRDRAVTAEDFAILAQQTPGVPVHTAYALARRALGPDRVSIVMREGAVTVVILPANPRQEAPQPSEAQLDAVCAYLNQRRLITTELHVTGPRYLSVESLTLTVRALQSADLQQVSDDIYSQLLTYFHPLHGGEDGRGWPFGEDVYLGNIYECLLRVDGVKRVVRLKVKLAGQDVDCEDVLEVPEGHLLHLSRDAIQLQVSYD